MVDEFYHGEAESYRRLLEWFRPKFLRGLPPAGCTVDPDTRVRRIWDRELIGTPGEAFLLHLERELNPVRSYKMVVLGWLLESGPERVEWSVEEIARGFQRYYLEHPEHRADYPALARAPDPEAFPPTRVERKMREMPLRYLSNTEADFFVLDRETDRFRIKDAVAPYWGRAEFRGLVRPFGHDHLRPEALLPYESGAN